MSDNLAVKIVNAIADEKGVPPTELDYTIQDHVETDAVELLASSDTGPWTLSFECPDGTVTVRQNGAVTVELVEESGAPTTHVSGH